MYAVLNCHKWHKISVFITHSFIILFIADVRNNFIWFCLWRNIIYYVLNPIKWSVYIYTLFFLQTGRDGGVSKAGSVGDKQLFGWRWWRRKWTVGQQADLSFGYSWLCCWLWKCLAPPIIRPEVWGWLASKALLEGGQWWGSRRPCNIQGHKNEYSKLIITLIQRTRYWIVNCVLFKVHNFCNAVQLWLLAAGTKQNGRQVGQH